MQFSLSSVLQRYFKDINTVLCTILFPSTSFNALQPSDALWLHMSGSSMAVPIASNTINQKRPIGYTYLCWICICNYGVFPLTVTELRLQVGNFISLSIRPKRDERGNFDKLSSVFNNGHTGIPDCGSGIYYVRICFIFITVWLDDKNSKRSLKLPRRPSISIEVKSLYPSWDTGTLVSQ